MTQKGKSSKYVSTIKSASQASNFHSSETESNRPYFINVIYAIKKKVKVITKAHILGHSIRLENKCTFHALRL